MRLRRHLLPCLALAALTVGCAESGPEAGPEAGPETGPEAVTDRPTILFIDAAGDVSRMMRLDPGAVEADVVRPTLAPSARGLTLDRATGIVYWASREGDRIQFGRWNDASLSDLPVTGLDSAYAVEYLADDNTLYWSDYGTDAIHRLDLGGGDVEVVIDGLEAPRQIAIDPATRQLYWVDRGSGRVDSAPIDSPSERRNLAVGLSAPYGITLLPGENAVLVADAELGTLYRIDLASGELTTWLEEAGTHPSFLAVDSAADMLYWGDNRDNVIRRRPLAGGPMETIVDGLAGPRGLVLIR